MQTDDEGKFIVDWVGQGKAERLAVSMSSSECGAGLRKEKCASVTIKNIITIAGMRLTVFLMKVILGSNGKH